MDWFLFLTAPLRVKESLFQRVLGLTGRAKPPSVNRMKRLKPFILMLYGLNALLSANAQSSDASLRKAIVDTALKYQGVPYVYGAMSPNAFDCSGFVGYVYKKAADISLPRSSKAIWSAGMAISLNAAKSGDILVFDTVGGAPSHVAIYIDKNRIIHAVSAGPKTGVIISPLSDSYFAPRLLGARTYVPTTVTTASQAISSAQNTEKPLIPIKPTPSYKPVELPAPPATPAKAPAAASLVQPEKIASPAIEENSPDNQNPEEIIGFEISDQTVIYTDKIPAALGSALRYAITNNTGRDGVFEILFYKMDIDPSKHKTLRQDRVNIKAGAMLEVDPYTFLELGQYKLILKTHDNRKRVERVWKVVDIR